MKTIRGKLITYFLIFILLFQVTAISIFISSNNITNTYDDSFKRFLLLNSISQKTEDLYAYTKAIVKENNPASKKKYFKLKKSIQKEKERMENTFAYDHVNYIKIQNYFNLIDTYIHDSELTVGFVLMDDVEQYTRYLLETRNTSKYIQDTTLELINMELTAYQSIYQNLQKRNENFFLFIICLFITMILTAVFFALRLSKSVTNPIERLSVAAKEVSAGDFLGDPVFIESNDELKLLGDAFNDMRENINELVTEIRDQSELDRLLKEMELKQLQSQINPHFLFNTLNTLSKMAYLEDAKQTSYLTDSVAALLRYSLVKIDKQTTLKEEVAVVRDYFRIQKTRFSERVSFAANVDETCLHIAMPRLTLQPLVENAFIHGIDNQEQGGSICLRVYRDAAHIIVEISDDGTGIDKDKLEQILTLTNQGDEHVGHSTGIGLVNVIRRLQLYYQTDQVVEIESEIDKGTIVRLILPEKGGEQNANTVS